MTFTNLNGASNDTLDQATGVDNATNLYEDVLIFAVLVTGTGSGAGDYIDVYAAGSVDGAGAEYSGEASGSDGAYTGTDANLKFLGRVATASASTTYEAGPWSLATAFGGVMPDRWTIVVNNKSDSTLATAGNQIEYIGVTHTVA